MLDDPHPPENGDPMQSGFRQLDSETLQFFEKVVAGPAKGFHVRRYIQVIQDLGIPFSQLTVLDLACGEGVYAIESALQGAKVLGIDGRTERMEQGNAVARRLGLENLQFEQQDIRNVTVASHGQYDVVFVIGIAYHLESPAIFSFLENIYGITRNVALIDTHTALVPNLRVTYKGRDYEGVRIREHEDGDSEDVKRKRLIASLDNTFSFVLSKDSLVRFLTDLGFTSIFECHAPLDPNRDANRITLLALKGTRAKINSYSWVNDEVDSAKQAALLESRPSFKTLSNQNVSGRLRWPRRFFRRLGFDIRRIPSGK